MKTINIPNRARQIVYVITALGTPIVAYLNARGVLGDLEVALWSAEVAVAGGLAAINVTATEPDGYVPEHAAE